GWQRIFGMRWIQPGDPLDLLIAAFPTNDQNGNAVLRTDSTRLAYAGCFASGNRRMFDDTTILVPIETLRTLLGHDIHDPNSIDLVTDVAIQPRAGLSPAGVAALAQRLAAAASEQLRATCQVYDWQ